MFAPHDLLWLADPGALTTDAPLPAWATRQWLAVAPVVVRRAAPAQLHQVPVGLRGATRSERFPAQVPVAAVVESKSPEAIVDAWLRRGHRGPGSWPCLQALAELAPRLNELALVWGVTGSVGFTLASGFDVMRIDSDLDLLVRATSVHDGAVLRDLGAMAARAAVRVDVQIETPLGAFSLAEWLRTGGPVLLKTGAGPLLVDDPWQAPPTRRATAAA